MKTAKRSQQAPIGFAGQARLFRLSAPIDYRTQSMTVRAGQVNHRMARTEYVVVSQATRTRSDQQPETKVFPAGADGKCLSWFHIGEPHEGHPPMGDVLKQLGYELTD